MLTGVDPSSSAVNLQAPVEGETAVDASRFIPGNHKLHDHRY